MRQSVFSTFVSWTSHFYHQILITGRVHAQRQTGWIAGRIIRLIRLILTAPVVMPDGTKVAVQEGTPQGGPLSPLLSNVVLDELDRELARQGGSPISPRSAVASGNRPVGAARYNGSRSGWTLASPVGHSPAASADQAPLSAPRHCSFGRCAG
jgi:hypothetical protein